MIGLFPTYHDQPEDQPLVGEIRWLKTFVILCKEKSRTVVEYALHDARKPIGVATYRTVKRLPKELKGHLPEPEQIIKLLEEVPECMYPLHERNGGRKNCKTQYCFKGALTLPRRSSEMAMFQ